MARPDSPPEHSTTPTTGPEGHAATAYYNPPVLTDPIVQANLARFARLVAQPEPAIDLAIGALCVAAADGREVDFELALAELDSLAERVRHRVDLGDGMEEVIEAVDDVLFRQSGFRGPTSIEFHDPRNSLIDVVLERRVGLPLSLAIVEIEVAGRVGLPLHGVGLPGHFLVGAPDGRVMDPTEGGRRLTPDDCQALLRSVLGNVLFHASMLRPVGKREMLARLLRNLRGAYTAERGWQAAYHVVDLLATLEPGDAEHSRDRGILLGRMGRFTEALINLGHYLDAQPAAPDTAEVRQVMSLFSGRRN